MSLAGNWQRIVRLGAVWHKPLRHGLPSEPNALQATAQLSYVITSEAQQRIDDHAGANRETEVGGLLVGEVHEDQGRYLVRVTEALAARHTIGGPVSLTFTGRTWLDILARRSQIDDVVTVGWYHSHPRLGVFLSEMDLFGHRHFFGGACWYLALVVDPVADEQGVFVWNGDQIVRSGSGVSDPPASERSRLL